MEVPTHQTFQIALSPEHLQLVLNGLSELPYKTSNGLIKYIQHQVKNQVEQARAAAQPVKKPDETENEIKQIREEDPELSAAIDKAAAESTA